MNDFHHLKLDCQSNLQSKGVRTTLLASLDHPDASSHGKRMDRPIVNKKQVIEG